MTKENIMEALTACAFSFGCESCPYNGIKDCKEQLCNDAVKQLKASNSPKYDNAIIFTKTCDLLPYLKGRMAASSHRIDENQARNLREHYSREREIHLILLTRYTKDGKLMCRIKCPISPLPVKGEFEAPCYTAIYEFILNNGWKHERTVSSRMFE